MVLGLIKRLSSIEDTIINMYFACLQTVTTFEIESFLQYINLALLTTIIRAHKLVQIVLKDEFINSMNLLS